MRTRDRPAHHLLVVHGSMAVRDRIGVAAAQTHAFRSIRRMTNGRFALEHCLDGLQHAKEAPPDLVVLDLQLPGLNGIQFTRELRRADPHRKILVAFLASSARSRDQDAAETAGADFFLPRPESLARLTQLLTTLALRIETHWDYTELDAYLAETPYGCAMLNDNAV